MRCKIGSMKALETAKTTKARIEEQEGQDSETRYLEGMRNADLREQTEW